MSVQVKSKKGEFARAHVTEIGLTTTKLHAEGVDIILPNSAVVKSLYGRVGILPLVSNTCLTLGDCCNLSPHGT